MKKLAIALDEITYEKAQELLKDLKNLPLIVKIGPHFFFKYGKKAIELVKLNNFELFIDFKFHDIPNTIKLSIEALKDIEPDYITVHILGGPEMLKKAVSAKFGNLKILGVTVLTSHDDTYTKFLKTNLSLKELVYELASTAKDLNLDGIVCSGIDLDYLSSIKLLKVVPGIRLNKENSQDQKRVMTPLEAFQKGADIIVMGRDIYNSKDPKRLIQSIINN